VAAVVAGGGGGGRGQFALPTPAEIWQLLFGFNGEQIPGQGQPNWNPLQYLQNVGNFISGNQKAIAYLQQNLPQALGNPAQLQALAAYFFAWQTFRVFNWTLRTLRFLLQTAPLLSPAVLNLAVVNLAGLAGMAGLAGLAQPTPPVPADPLPVAAPPELRPVALVAVPVPPSAPAPMAPATAAPLSAAPAAPTAPPVPVTGVEGFAYLVGGPGPGFGPTLGARMSAAEPASDSAATAASAAAAVNREQARAARRLRTTIDRGYRYEFLSADEELASDGPVLDPCQSSGVGSLGFAGAATKAGVRPAGLTSLADDGFGGGPKVPMVPESWTAGPGQVNGEAGDRRGRRQV